MDTHPALLMKTWKIRSQSPLHGFVPNAKSLSVYTKDLINFLQSENVNISMDTTAVFHIEQLPNEEHDGETLGAYCSACVCLFVDYSECGSLTKNHEIHTFTHSINSLFY